MTPFSPSFNDMTPSAALWPNLPLLSDISLKSALGFTTGRSLGLRQSLVTRPDYLPSSTVEFLLRADDPMLRAYWGILTNKEKVDILLGAVPAPLPGLFAAIGVTDSVDFVRAVAFLKLGLREMNISGSDELRSPLVQAAMAAHLNIGEALANLPQALRPSMLALRESGVVGPFIPFLRDGLGDGSLSDADAAELMDAFVKNPALMAFATRSPEMGPDMYQAIHVDGLIWNEFWKFVLSAPDPVFNVVVRRLTKAPKIELRNDLAAIPIQLLYKNRSRLVDISSALLDLEFSPMVACIKSDPSLFGKYLVGRAAEIDI